MGEASNKQNQPTPNPANNMQRDEAKKVLQSALLGERDIHQSIETLAEILFPGENIIEFIKQLKIQNELDARLGRFSDRFTVEKVQKVDDVLKLI